jgi:hypothetical protein
MSQDELNLAELYIPQSDFLSVPGKSRECGRTNSFVNGKFLKGPIPLSWLSRACEIGGGKTLATALAIWWVSGLRNSSKTNLRITTETLKQFAVTERNAKYRALQALENAGLIKVVREKGKNPFVTIIDVPVLQKRTRQEVVQNGTDSNEEALPVASVGLCL